MASIGEDLLKEGKPVNEEHHEKEA